MADGKGSLIWKFTKAAAYTATIGVVAAVSWQIFLDPIFFPIFHDPTNQTAQAFVKMINTNFSFIPEFLGLKGDSGLLNSEFAQTILEPYYETVKVASNDQVVTGMSDLGGLSLDAL